MTALVVLDEALAALARGWTPVPVGEHKRPAIKWKELQTKQPSPEMVWRWFAPQSRHECWGLVHGAVAGTMVIDLDNKPNAGGGIEQVLLALVAEYGLPPPTVTAETPSGGLHLFFSHPGVNVPTRKNLRPGVDVRGDGGFTVGPGSTTTRGTYVWTSHPDTTPLADLPPAWLDLITAPTIPRSVPSASGTQHQLGDITIAEVLGPFGILWDVVVDGRETHAITTIGSSRRWLERRLHRQPTFDELRDTAWRQFASTTDLNRTLTTWSFDDRVRKILSRI